jgi:phosphoribosyl-dephospho-CoA transferase
MIVDMVTCEKQELENDLLNRKHVVPLRHCFICGGDGKIRVYDIFPP